MFSGCCRKIRRKVEDFDSPESMVLNDFKRRFLLENRRCQVILSDFKRRSLLQNEACQRDMRQKALPETAHHIT